MVYVGKKGDGAPGGVISPEDEMRIPREYSGNAFDADGAARNFDPDGEALRRAEEMFRRGYVFEDEAIHNDSAANETPATGDAPASQPEPPRSGDVHAVSARPEKRGMLGGLFGNISTEEILIGALIVMLLVNGGDDELLIMLVILLFC